MGGKTKKIMKNNRYLLHPEELSCKIERRRYISKQKDLHTMCPRSLDTFYKVVTIEIGSKLIGHTV